MRIPGIYCLIIATILFVAVCQATAPGDRPQFPWQKAKVNGQAPPGRIGQSASVVGSEMIVFGGCLQETECSNDVNVFQTTNATWYTPQIKQRVAPPPRGGHSATVLGKNRIYIIGGNSVEGFRNDVFVLNGITKTWSKPVVLGASLPAERGGHSAVVYKGRIYVFGGSTEHGLINDLWQLNTRVHSWSKVPVASKSSVRPPGLALHSAVVIGDRMYVYGGRTDRDANADVYVFDFLANVWSKPFIKGASPLPRYSHHASTRDGRYMFIVGGCNALRNECYSDSFVLDTQDMQWVSPATAQPYLPKDYFNVTDPYDLSASDEAAKALPDSIKLEGVVVENASSKKLTEATIRKLVQQDAEARKFDAQMDKMIAEELKKKKLIDATTARLEAEEAARKKALEDAKKKAEAEAAAKKKKAEEEAAAKKKAEEEAAAKKKKAEEEAAAKKKKAEEEAAAKKKKAAEEAAAKKKAAEDAAAKKKAGEDTAAKKKAQVDAAAKKKAEEDAAAKKKAEEDAAAKKKAEEDAAAKKKAEEDEAAKKKAEEDAAAKKKAEEEQKANEQAAMLKAATSGGIPPMSLASFLELEAPLLRRTRRVFVTDPWFPSGAWIERPMTDAEIAEEDRLHPERAEQKASLPTTVVLYYVDGQETLQERQAMSESDLVGHVTTPRPASLAFADALLEQQTTNATSPNPLNLNTTSAKPSPADEAARLKAHQDALAKLVLPQGESIPEVLRDPNPPSQATLSTEAATAKLTPIASLRRDIERALANGEIQPAPKVEPSEFELKPFAPEAGSNFVGGMFGNGLVLFGSCHLNSTCSNDVYYYLIPQKLEFVPAVFVETNLADEFIDVGIL